MKYVIQSNSRGMGKHWGDMWTHEKECLSLRIAKIEIEILRERCRKNKTPIEHRIVCYITSVVVIDESLDSELELDDFSISINPSSLSQS